MAGVNAAQDNRSASFKTFTEFVCYFRICKVLKTTNLKVTDVVNGINHIRMKKDRCLAQTICSNNHAHLLLEIVRTKSSNPISVLVNSNINLNQLDATDQAPLMCSLRQASSEYAKIILSANSVHPIDINKQSLKHGYPLHMAILSHKFDIACDLMRMTHKIKPDVLNSIGANLVHLLFVNYDNDAVNAFKILKLCIYLKVNPNLVDQIQAAPIHIALRKKQYQALKDMV